MISNTIMGIRHTGWMNNRSITSPDMGEHQPHNTEGEKFNHSSRQQSWRSWWSETRTLQTRRNWFTVSLLFQLHIHQCRRCVFTELSSPIKQVPWFFMCIPITALTFGYSLSLPVLRKDTELIFAQCQRMESNHYLSAVNARFWPLFPMSYLDLTAVWRLAIIFIVPCNALGF